MCFLGHLYLGDKQIGAFSGLSKTGKAFFTYLYSDILTFRSALEPGIYLIRAYT